MQIFFFGNPLVPGDSGWNCPKNDYQNHRANSIIKYYLFMFMEYLVVCRLTTNCKFCLHFFVTWIMLYTIKYFWNIFIFEDLRLYYTIKTFLRIEEKQTLKAKNLFFYKKKHLRKFLIWKKRAIQIKTESLPETEWQFIMKVFFPHF